MHKKGSISRFMTRFGAAVSAFVLGANMTAMLTANAKWKGCSVGTGCQCEGGLDVDVYHWNQGTWGIYGDKMSWADMEKPFGETMSAGGCFPTSTSILMKLSGQFDNLGSSGDGKFCPAVLINWANEKNKLFISGSRMETLEDFKDFPEPGTDAWHPFAVDEAIVSDMGLTAKNMRNGRVIPDAAGDSYAALYSLAVDLMQHGCYVVLNVCYKYKDARGIGNGGDHYVAAVGYIDADNPVGYEIITSDPGSGKGETADSKGERMLYDRDDAQKTNPNYGVGRNSSNGNEYCKENIVGLRVFVGAEPFSNGQNPATKKNISEQREASAINLMALGEYLNEEYFLDINYLQDYALELPDTYVLASDGGIGAVEELYDWKDSLDNRRKDRFQRNIRAVFMFVGIFMVIYSTLLFVSWMFDRMDNFFEVKLLRILTFGKLEASGEDGEGTFDSATGTGANGARLVNFKNITIVSVMGLVIGILLLSGKIYNVADIILFLIDKIRKFIQSVL